MVFISLLAGVTVAYAAFGWKTGSLGVLALLAWLAYETRQRTRFRFCATGVSCEANFELLRPAALVRISAKGRAAAFVSADHGVSLYNSSGKLCWSVQWDEKILDVLPLENGACYLAMEGALLLVDAQGSESARQAFEAPPFIQSYHLGLSGDGSVLMLHTPWFLHFFSADLQSESGRISCEQTGHFMKFAALSPDGMRVYFAGAKLVEDEGRGTEARWGCWAKDPEGWHAQWAGAEESGYNSHLRGLALSADGRRLVAELYCGGYEFRIFDSDGNLLWKRSGDHPVLSPDGSLVLWEDPSAGLTLSVVDTREKSWSRRSEDRVRWKAVSDLGECLALEGRRWVCSSRDGAQKWSVWLMNDTDHVAAAGGSLALADGFRGAMVRLPWNA